MQAAAGASGGCGTRFAFENFRPAEPILVCRCPMPRHHPCCNLIRGMHVCAIVLHEEAERVEVTRGRGVHRDGLSELRTRTRVTCGIARHLRASLAGSGTGCLAPFRLQCLV